MEEVQVNDSWCMDVVDHCYGGLSGGMDGGGDWYAGGTKPGVAGRMSGDSRALSENDVKILMAPGHTSFQVRSFCMYHI